MSFSSTGLWSGGGERISRTDGIRLMAPAGRSAEAPMRRTAHGSRERTYTRPMNRTRITGECLPQAAPALRAVPAGRRGIGPRTAADGQAPTVGRGALHGHG